MKAAAAFIGAIALLSMAPAMAQSADKTRLDEFAVSAPESNAQVEQLEPRAASQIADASSPAVDRMLTVPRVPGTQGPLVQLSSPEQGSATAQVASHAESRQLVSASASSTRDSRPRAMAALTGEDRCKPDSDAERSGQCQRILERRANEFSAAEAPRLSAEQVLLTQRPQNDEAAASVAHQRARLAGTGMPDADLSGNQELASLYLPKPQEPSASEQPATQEPIDAGAIVQVLQALHIGTMP